MQFQNKNVKPRKRSYYRFSKNYPSKSGNIYAIGESRTRRKKEKRNRTIFYASLVLVFAAVFLIVSVARNLSHRPIDGSAQILADSYDGQLKALEMPDEALGGGIAYELFRTQLKTDKANAVVVELKRADGKLNYNSSVQTALDIGACTDAYENATQTVEQLKADGYKIIASVYCFEDPLAASMLKGSAVTTQDGATVWLDDSAQNDGNPWLNPYSQTAQDYLYGIISECAAMGADTVMLNGVSFPSGELYDTAFFPGEAESVESRNSVLHTFVSKAAELCGDTQIAVCTDIDSALNGNEQLYSGSIFDSGALFNAVDFTRFEPTDAFSVGNASSPGMDKTALISATIPILQQKTDENYTTKGLLPIIDDEAYISILENSGINNYILIQKTDT